MSVQTAHEESGKKYRSFNTPPRPQNKGDFWSSSSPQNRGQSRPNGRFGRSAKFDEAFDKW